MTDFLQAQEEARRLAQQTGQIHYVIRKRGGFGIVSCRQWYGEEILFVAFCERRELVGPHE